MERKGCRTTQLLQCAPSSWHISPRYNCDKLYIPSLEITSCTAYAFRLWRTAYGHALTFDRLRERHALIRHTDGSDHRSSPNCIRRSLAARFRLEKTWRHILAASLRHWQVRSSRDRELAAYFRRRWLLASHLRVLRKSTRRVLSLQTLAIDEQQVAHSIPVRHFFRTWRCRFAAAKESALKALNLRRHRIAAVFVQRHWRALCAKARIFEQRLQEFRVLRRRSVYREWHRLAHLRLVHEHICKKQRTLLFQRWFEVVVRSLESEQVVCANSKRRTLQGIFIYWVSRVRQHQKIFADERRLALAKTALHRWRRLATRMRRASASAHAHFITMNLRRRFMQWRAHHFNYHQRVAKVVKARASRTQASFFNKWRQRQDKHVKLHALAQAQAIQSMQQTNMRAWKRVCVHHHLFRIFHEWIWCQHRASWFRGTIVDGR